MREAEWQEQVEALSYRIIEVKRSDVLTARQTHSASLNWSRQKMALYRKRIELNGVQRTRLWMDKMMLKNDFSKVQEYLQTKETKKDQLDPPTLTKFENRIRI